jgi:hypothetical protein
MTTVTATTCLLTLHSPLLPDEENCKLVQLHRTKQKSIIRTLGRPLRLTVKSNRFFVI